MKVTIEIECDDVDDIYTHLSVIRQQIKKKVKKLDPNVKWEPFTITDSNCYGTHTCTVVDDLGPFCSGECMELLN